MHTPPTRALLAAALSLLVAGCATIMHGTQQDVGFGSVPTNARITVDNQRTATTPTVMKLSRKDNHIVRIELDGYLPYEATLTRSVSGWVWGNIVIGGLVGLAVDAISGGLYKLTPDQMTATLGRQAGAADDGTLQVHVVLRADPAWERIGQLAR
ncbi:MAG TPA: PEGA domain-containing protein [Gemmatimonadaceae bacterium]|nr:PEGA domain-containing protein [Gemmatimonadaceae bacterium]